jgi:hypothetical protein
MAQRSTLGPEKDPGSGRSIYNYIVTIDYQGSSEAPLFGEIDQGGPVIHFDVSASLSYICDLEKLDLPLQKYYLVGIYAKSSLPYRQTSFTLPLSPEVTSLSFSPDETRLAISFDNEKFIITNLQGEGTKEYAQGGNFIWKDDKSGFFYKKDVSKLALINLDSNEINVYPADIIPMTYNASDETIYSVSGNIFKSYKLGSTEVVQKTLNFDPQKYIRPHISSDGKKIVMATTPYLLPNGTSYEAGGIYLIDVDENELKEIRYYTNEKVIPTKN